MRRAFYCGAYSFLAEMTNSLEPGQDATDADIENLEAARLEMEAFFAHLTMAPTGRPS